MSNLSELRSDLKKYWNPKKADFLQTFFSTDENGYGRGDIFRGVTVPDSRLIAQKFAKIFSINESFELLASSIHEERLIALFILVSQYKSGDEETKTEIVQKYLKNTKYINNWDLVDSSADKILGEYLLDKPSRNILEKLAHASDLWEKRISIISTYAFIKKEDYQDTLKIAEILLSDQHDLIHKAVGWMLREVGKRCSEKVLIDFLKKNYPKIPRTTLRYAIERFPEDKRKKYLIGDFS